MTADCSLSAAESAPSAATARPDRREGRRYDDAVARAAIDACLRESRRDIRDGDHRARLPARSGARVRQARRGRCEPDGNPATHLRRERCDDRFDILVGEDAADGNGAPRMGPRSKACGERRRGFGVVRDIEDPLRRARDHLEPARQAYRAESRSHGLIGHQQ
jgi:hypothetical protein